MQKVNTLSISIKPIMEGIREYLYKAADDVLDHLKEAFQIEVFFGGAGKTKWREEAGKAFGQIERIITEDYIECQFGISDKLMSDEDMYARVQVALFGNQANGNIRSKPGGYVYGDTMENDLHVSNALSNWDIPQFDQIAYGDKMFENTIKLCTKYFRDALDAAVRSIPDSLFYENVIVTGG